MKFIKSLPLTGLYIFLHLLYTALYSEVGGSLSQPSIQIPLPKDGVVHLSVFAIFVMIAMLIFAIEFRKASRFEPRKNNIDAVWSILFAGAYLVAFLFYAFFQTELFMILTGLACIDALIGLGTILGIARRSFDVDPN